MGDPTSGEEKWMVAVRYQKDQRGRLVITKEHGKSRIEVIGIKAKAEFAAGSNRSKIYFTFPDKLKIFFNSKSAEFKSLAGNIGEFLGKAEELGFKVEREGKNKQEKKPIICMNDDDALNGSCDISMIASASSLMKLQPSTPKQDQRGGVSATNDSHKFTQQFAGPTQRLGASSMFSSTNSVKTTPKIGRACNPQLVKIPMSRENSLKTQIDGKSDDIGRTQKTYSGTLSTAQTVKKNSGNTPSFFDHVSFKPETPSSVKRPASYWKEQPEKKPLEAIRKESCQQPTRSPSDAFIRKPQIDSPLCEPKKLRKPRICIIKFMETFSFEYSMKNERLEDIRETGYNSLFSKYAYKALENPNNHCYLNSVLQVVCSRPIFATYVLKAYNLISGHASSTLTEIFRVLADVCLRLPVQASKARELGLKRYDIAPLNKLIRYLGENYCDQFLENDCKNQQDAQEFYGCLIDALEDQCEGKRPKNEKHIKTNVVPVKETDVLENDENFFTPSASQSSGDPNIDATTLENTILERICTGKNNESQLGNNKYGGNKENKLLLTHDRKELRTLEKRPSTNALVLPPNVNPARLFHIGMTYKRICDNCGNPSRRDDKSNLIQVSLDSSETNQLMQFVFGEEIPTIQYLLDRVFANESLEVTCEKCSGKTATNQLRLRENFLPAYLMIMVMRYSHATGVLKRLDHSIHIDKEIGVESYLYDAEKKNSCLSAQSFDISSDMERSPSRNRVLRARNRMNQLPKVMETQKSDDIFERSSVDEDNMQTGGGQKATIEVNEKDLHFEEYARENQDDHKINIDQISDESISNISDEDAHMDEAMNSLIEPEVKKPKLEKNICDYCLPSTDHNRIKWLRRTYLEKNEMRASNTISGPFVYRPPPWNFFKTMTETFGLKKMEDHSHDFGAVRHFASTATNTRDHEIQGDGNCLFRALSWWLTGSEDQHFEIRTLICAFLRTYPEKFQGLLKENENIDAHIRLMSEETTWGTHVELSAAATLFSITIYTLLDRSWKLFRPRFFWYQDDLPEKLDGNTLHGLYLNNEGFHYDVILEVLPRRSKNRSYSLVGVVNHSGRTVLSGHYTALVEQVLHSREGKVGWLNCDDAMITERANLQEALSKSDANSKAYLLLYRRRDISAIDEYKQFDQQLEDEYEDC